MTSSSVARRRGRRSLTVGLALAASGVLLAALLAEALLRLTAYHRQFAERDATIGYVLAPHFTRVVPAPEHAGGQVVLRTNNLGLRRDGDTTVSKPPGTQRVLLLGDSQTEGIVENAESYAALIERSLNGNGARPAIEVLNAAASGYSPLLEYLWWRERGRALQPDLAILALYVGNDVGELLMRHEDFGGFGPRLQIPFLTDSGGREIVPPGAGDGVTARLDYILEAHSRAYALLHRVFHGTPAAAPPGFAPVAAQCPGCLQSLWQASVAQGVVDGLAEGFARLDYVLAHFREETVRAGVASLIVVIPSRVQIEPPAATEAATAATLLGLHYDPAAFDDAVAAQMIALSEQHSFPTIDLRPPLRAAWDTASVPLYWSLDWHLNTRGHQVVAEALAPAIARQLRLPAEPR